MASEESSNDGERALLNLPEILISAGGSASGRAPSHDDSQKDSGKSMSNGSQ